MLKAIRSGLLVLAAGLAPITAVHANADCDAAAPEEPLLAPLEAFSVGGRLLPLAPVADPILLPRIGAGLEPLGGNKFELLSPLLPTPNLGSWQILSDRYWLPLSVSEARLTQEGVTALDETVERWLSAPVERAVPF
jgi:hypothetical protein